MPRPCQASTTVKPISGGVAKRRVAAFGDDEFVASAWDSGHQTHVVPVADVVEPTQVVVAQKFFWHRKTACESSEAGDEERL